MPDELVTISGQLLGPLQPVYAILDATGNLPFQLAGVEVRLNGIAMPLASVQQGMITFYVTEDTPASNALNKIPLEVRSGGVAIASMTTWVQFQPRFAILTADGSGSGFAAALNQDGTLNPNKPAPLGSIVSIFGIGAAPSRMSVGGVVAEIDYAGPAPGLLPGVKQVNLRVPDNIVRGMTDFVPLSTTPASPGGLPVYLKVNTQMPADSALPAIP